MISGTVLIMQERERQKSAEGYSAEHDDEHGDRSLAIAAACYAIHGLVDIRVVKIVQTSEKYPYFVGYDAWPWGPVADKRGRQTRLRALIKAGALIAAEIDRLQRDGQTP